MGILSKFKNGFRKGSDLLQGALSKVSGNKALDESDLLELEEALYESDFGVESTEEIIGKILIITYQFLKSISYNDPKQI